MSDIPEFPAPRPRAVRAGRITLREIAILIAVVAIGLRVLPRPLDSLTAFVVPPVYLLARICPFLLRLLGYLGYVAWVVVPFVPAWITGDPADISLAKAALLITSPTVVRFMTRRRYTALWDILDPLVIATALPAVGAVGAVIGRLFAVCALSWK
jgi:hypothetical protein